MTLTKIQKTFLESLRSEKEDGIYLWCECFKNEWRTAKSLRKKNLIEIMDSDTDESVKIYYRFEARAL